ncbi:MAG: protein translocase subunit SecD [Planctomycetales bacterium]|nr:protein translocase subunit SecD [Planctomycetales bacterium]
MIRLTSTFSRRVSIAWSAMLLVGVALFASPSSVWAQADAPVADAAETLEGAPPEPAEAPVEATPADAAAPTLVPPANETPDESAPSESNSDPQPADSTTPASSSNEVPTDQPAEESADGASTDVDGDETAADDAEVAETGTSESMNALVVLAVLAVLIVIFWLSGRFSNSVRMPDHGWKIGLALCTIVAASIVTVTRWPPLLGPDLSGGVNLIYQIDPDESKDVPVDKLIAAISRRINPSGLKEVTIRPYGQRQVEIIIPRADPAEVELIKRGLENAGVLEFRITASSDSADDAQLIKLARESASRSVLINGVPAGKWVLLSEEKFPVGERGDLVLRDAPNGQQQVLVKFDPYNVTGGDLSTTYSGIDNTGNPAVNFTFEDAGAGRFADLTTKNAPIPGSNFQRRLGIVLDDVLLSAPNLREPITGGHGQISGRFTPEEVEFLISILNAGSLPAALDPTPISELSTSATLGADTIRKGQAAMTISMVLVVVFMLVYYRFAGFVACLALASNLVLLLATMIAFRAAFTLPGIAGLVLTVGMAVDANVLIFERIREELAKGSALRLAIRNGFDRATQTILDANITTLITAVVLFWIGTDQIKGFAVTLILGIVMSMYTAIFCSRIVFDLAERVQKMTNLSMMQALGNTQFDFLGKRNLAFVGSLAIIVLGLVGVVNRNKGLLDIDFMGGSSVTIVFKDSQPIEDVRTTASVLPDLTVRGVGEVGSATADKSYAIDTSDRDLAHVEKTLEEAFAGLLVTNSLSHSPLAESGPGEGGTPELSTQLTFGEEIKYDTLDKMVAEAFEENNIPVGAYSMVNPNYAPGSSQAYHDWKLSLVVPGEQAEALVQSLAGKINAMTVFPSASNIGGKVASDTQLQAALAILASLVFIVAYIWIRFQHIIFGLAAVLALVHDVLVTLGILALSKYIAEHLGFIAGPLMIEEFKISLTIVAAFLTIVGYSLNDTIVVFDRIREVRGKSPGLTGEMINTSINQTLSRTLLTSLTTLIVVVILYFGGGPGIHGFAFALTVGVMVGTYSSVFIASPALLWMMDQGNKAGTQPRKTAKQVA